MVEEVNKIIYNMLISGRGVFLPEVGTLFIERQGARRIAKDRLMSPRNVVTFSSQEQAPSLVDEIVAIAGCSKEQAQDIYERWIGKTRVDGSLTIGSIGILRGKSFVVDNEFVSTINPKGVKTLVVRGQRSHAWIYVIGAIAVVVALAFFAYLQWGAEWGSDSNKPNVANDEVVLAQTTSDAGDKVSSDETTASDAATESTTVEAQSQVATSSQNPSYAFYVVAGVFSTEQNAALAVEQLRANIKEVKAETLPFNGKYMVTAFGSNSREECNVFVRSYRDVYPDLWVYNKK